ncbi:Filament-like plant protein 7 [Bienertia sinuspersici]
MAEMEKDIRYLKEKHSNAIAQCNDKDYLVIKHSKTAKEALTEELEETKMFFEEKLEEMELNQQKAKVEEEVTALLERLEQLQKDNNSLLYDVRVLEKEVDNRNEEREFHRRSADASHKHHLENVKKIARLVSECQKLCVLVRRRMPGPAALAKMRSENGKVEFEVFAQEITLVLEWIMSHCFSLQQDSSMKDAIKKQLDWDETRSGSQIKVITFELSKLSLKKDGYHIDCHRNNVSEEVRKVRNVGRDLGANFECISLINQLQKSEDTITSLQLEIEDLRLSKAVIEEQYEYYIMAIEDLNSQLLDINARMDEDKKTIGSLQEEIENKVNQYEEEKCHD